MSVHLKHEAFGTYEKTNVRPGNVIFNAGEAVQAHVAEGKICHKDAAA